MNYSTGTKTGSNRPAEVEAAFRKPPLPPSLRPADFIVHRLLRSASAPPFLGLLDVPKKTQEESSQAVKSLSGRDWSKCLRLLSKYPNFGAWYLCDTVRRSYGSDGTMRVWPDIAEAMGFEGSVPVPLREELHKIVAVQCRKLGLPVPTEDYVSLFRLHAGVSKAQLPELLRAFMAQQKHYGLPDADDGNALNEWEDQALHFVPHGLTVLRKPILWDMTAWHASLFLDCINGTDRITSNFRPTFDEIIAKLQSETAKTGTRNVIAPRPRLILNGLEIALRLPEGNRRHIVQFDEASPRRVRAGSLLALPTPLPQRISFGPEGGAIDLLRHQGELIVGDMDAPGELLRVRDGDALPMSNIVLFSRSPFGGTGSSKVQSHEIAEGLHSASCELSPTRPLTLDVGGCVATIRRKLYRRITLRDGVIGRRLGRALYDLNATVNIQTGFAMSGERLLELRLGDGVPRICTITTDQTGAREVPLRDLFVSCGFDQDLPPQILRIELLRPIETEGETPAGTGVRMRAEVWPGFQRRCGAELQSLSPPQNLCLQESRGIASDAQGYPCTDPTSAEAPQIAFKIESSLCIYDLPPNELALTHLLPDGSARPFPIGNQLQLTSDTIGGAIRINCVEEGVEIELPQGKRFKAFQDGGTRTVSLRALSAGWLRLHKPDGRHVDLAELRTVAQFDHVEIERRFGAVRLCIQLPDRIDAVRAEIEMEMGQRETATVHFGPERHMHRSPGWMAASRLHGGTIQIDFNCRDLSPGVWLGQLQICDDAGWHPVQTARGDVLSFVLARGSPEPDEFMTEERLSRVSGWLDLCHAEESWKAGAVGSTLTSRKKALAVGLLKQPAGRAQLMKLCLSEVWFDTGSSWMPPMHMLHDCPSLFEGPVTDFHLAGGTLARLAWLDNSRIRDFQDIDTFALIGFSNVANAQETGEKLKHFNADKLLKALESWAPSSLRRWPGRPLLGPGHWRAAHHLLQDRLDQTGFFGDDAEGNNGLRSLALLRIHSSLSPATPAIPIPPDLPEEHREIHCTLSRILRSFSIAARAGQTESWCDAISRPEVLSTGHVLSGVGDLIRLAPELFAFHLFAAELERRTK